MVKSSLFFDLRSLLCVKSPIISHVAYKTKGFNYNFLNTGKSAFDPRTTDIDESNVEFLRKEYQKVAARQSQVLKEALVSEQKEHSWDEIRCGAVGVKLGSYPLFLKDGKRTIATVVQLLDTEVVDVTTTEYASIPFLKRQKLNAGEKYFTVTVGCRNISPEWLSQSQMEVFKKHGITCKEKLTGFICTENAVLQPGTAIRADHFVPGQLINVWGRSMDRGFQGPMKRWNFRGMPATHGTTKSHRAHGALASTGQRRVLPGRRMAGQMGDKIVFKPNSRVLRINTEYNVVFIQGLLPGLDGNFLSLRDARYGKLFSKTGIESLPFPTNYNSHSNEDNDHDVYANDVFNFANEAIKFENEDS
ncbi:large ribosomal subunit protein uL3-like [Convolutriloba macropyga]|uniref:large ribosomal subunit protein uL3-like n=1 Tax=Convolutriloba macropyga TaxID=536237 RepID=UPI003F523C83